jgi:thiamine biosynthesis lipoprotein
VVRSTSAISRRQFLSLDSSSAPPSVALGGSEADYWIRVFRRVMACRFEVVLPGQDARFLPAARTALNLADRLEARLTVFRPTSELSRVNRLAAGEPVPVHPGLFSLLHEAADLHAATGGAFDITSTPLSRCWGFLQRTPHVPADESIAAARATVGMTLVELDERMSTVRFARRGVELNLGSIGKGYALDRMAEKLRRLGVRDALISAGGSSILALGADGGGWPVHITSKLCGGMRLAALRLRNVAMATSGAGEQFVVADGRRFGHVLDPRTGWPATGAISATVVTRDASTADALATACLIDGPALAERYCAAHPNTLIILALDDECGTVSMFGACTGAMVIEGAIACT